jgi:hypothetical protein
MELVAAADYDALAAKAAEHRDGRLVALERIRELEAAVRAALITLEPLADCDPAVRAWLATADRTGEHE